MDLLDWPKAVFVGRSEMKLNVAVVGRPNVGKSTLFNRLVGKKLALVDDRPGVTRDRREGEAQLGDLHINIIDTAGLEVADEDALETRMRLQTEEAIGMADVCLFMIDARAGITPMDEYFANMVRKAGKPTVLLANKSEGRASDAGFYEAFSLGLGDPVPVSAEHGIGMSDLYEHLVKFEEKMLEELGDQADDDVLEDDDQPLINVDIEDDESETPLYDPTKPVARCDRRPSQCREVDADQSFDRTGSSFDRTGSRDHAG